MLKDCSGIYNIVEDEPVNYPEMFPDKKVMGKAKQEELCKLRSNCVLSNQKLKDEGFEFAPFNILKTCHNPKNN